MTKKDKGGEGEKYVWNIGLFCLVSFLSFQSLVLVSKLQKQQQKSLQFNQVFLSLCSSADRIARVLSVIISVPQIPLCHRFGRERKRALFGSLFLSVAVVFCWLVVVVVTLSNHPLEALEFRIFSSPLLSCFFIPIFVLLWFFYAFSAGSQTLPA